MSNKQGGNFRPSDLFEGLLLASCLPPLSGPPCSCTSSILRHLSEGPELNIGKGRGVEKREPQAQRAHGKKRLGTSTVELLAVRTGWESGRLKKGHLLDPSGMGGPIGSGWGS